MNNYPLSRPGVKFSRFFAMPNADTFSIQPIADFVRLRLNESKLSVDPFARNKRWATFTNDLNPETFAECHMDAEDFLKSLAEEHAGTIDLFLFDPPYSPRQISEVYKSIGREVGMAGTQNGALYRRVRDAAMPLLTPDAVCLSFGWNSVGMGKGRGFKIEEIMLVNPGGAHNDYICMAERRTATAETKEGK